MAINIKPKLEAVKSHILRNKWKYITLALMLVGVAAGVTCGIAFFGAVASIPVILPAFAAKSAVLMPIWLGITGLSAGIYAAGLSWLASRGISHLISQSKSSKKEHSQEPNHAVSDVELSHTKMQQTGLGAKILDKLTCCGFGGDEPKQDQGSTKTLHHPTSSAVTEGATVTEEATVTESHSI